MQSYEDILMYTKILVPIETSYSDGRTEVFVYNNQIDIVHDFLNKEFYFTEAKDRHIPDPVDRTLHREDGPAVIYSNGYKAWYNSGNRHREDGPAVIYSDGTKEWYINGKIHREDGPAVIYSNGTKEWYINGERHREDGPTIIYSSGSKVWYINGKRHRTDGPAFVYSNGDKAWYINDKLHREDGPAIICSNGYKEWWIYDINYTFKEYCSILKLSQEQILKLALKYNL